MLTDKQFHQKLISLHQRITATREASNPKGDRPSPQFPKQYPKRPTTPPLPPEMPEEKESRESAAKEGAEKLGVSWADARHYAMALARWAKAGFPVREQAEVERIEREICRPCEKYVDGRCKQCGCRVTASSLAVANKIKMATENCPLGKWLGATATPAATTGL